mmetsp:Transcript_11463/g.39269  ORF Transcript_11463/g.39269 Transcript_11463/m.39269 type:complete len:94 (+) Transcript_11463:641-922(+)
MSRPTTSSRSTAVGFSIITVQQGIDAHELGLSLQDAAEQASRPKASRVPEMKLKEVRGEGESQAHGSARQSSDRQRRGRQTPCRDRREGEGRE